MNQELMDLWRTSKIALAGLDDSYHERLKWVVDSYHRVHPETPKIQIYKCLTSLLH